MARIIDFPTRVEREWKEVEGFLVSFLADHDVPDDFVDQVCQRLKPYWEKYTRDVGATLKLPPLIRASQDEIDALTSALDEFVNQVSEKVHDLTSEFLLDLLALEIKLYGYEKEED